MRTLIFLIFDIIKVRVFWEGHKIWNVKFEVEDFFKFCGLLRISEL